VAGAAPRVVPCGPEGGLTATSPPVVVDFPALESQCEAVKRALVEREDELRFEVPVRVVVSPYRVALLGAHVDHQGGRVLGKTLNAFTVLAFAPAAEPLVRMHSVNYSGVTTVALEESPAPEESEHWGRYLYGARSVLARTLPLKRGMVGIVQGTLPGGGLSSSASVGLAYLIALAEVNGYKLTSAQLIELDRQLENDYLGLQNGVQDQTIITLARPDALLDVDTKANRHAYIPDPDTSDAYRLLIAYSGISRTLTGTGFNRRVEECRQAAEQLGSLSGLENARVLSDIPETVYRRYRDWLPSHLGRRADHYYSEMNRVGEGRDAWAAGDFARLGRLMTGSCESSIRSYECGCEELIRLHEIVNGTEGVVGSRFIGGGYGGCVAGFVRADCAQRVREMIRTAFTNAFPALGGKTNVFLARFDGRLRLR